MTDQAVIDKSPWPVVCRRVESTGPEEFSKYDLILVGNLHSSTRAQRRELARLRRHVLFEHDYRICRYRGNFARALRPSHRLSFHCNCRQGAWRDVFESALGVIFLTHRQLAVYRSNPHVRLPVQAVLGCSVMSDSFFEYAERHRSSPKAGSVVVYSKHRNKGYAEAVEYCRKRGIEPKTVRDAAPGDVWRALAGASELVYLPAWIEPAGRLAVEARFLGCQIVSNELLGVAGESWWSAPDEIALPFVQEAASRFWRLVGEFLEQKPRGLSGAGHPNREAYHVLRRP